MLLDCLRASHDRPPSPSEPAVFLPNEQMWLRQVELMSRVGNENRTRPARLEPDCASAYYYYAIGARGPPTGSPQEYPRATPPPTHPAQTRHTLPSVAPISRSSAPHTSSRLATRALSGRGERAARSKTFRPDGEAGVRARVRARARLERRERTSWGSRVCPGYTVCLRDDHSVGLCR